MFKKLCVFPILALVVIFVAGCAGSSPTPAPTLPPVPTVIQPNTLQAKSPDAFQPQTSAAEQVTIQVTPLTLAQGKPIEFEIVMDTHSVELDADMLQAVILRDDAGKEYKPLNWEGPGGGGHHRSGKITFDALPANTRTVTLTLKDVAGVPERTFTWQLSSADANEIPQTLAGLKLVNSATGKDALREFESLHGKGFDLVGGYRANYARGKNTATLWVARANDAASALALTQEMAKKIGTANAMFQNLQELSINGRQLYVVDGQGQQHYFYANGDQVVWLAIDPPLASDALHALWNAK
jgi:hypothetical protein